MNIEKKLQFRKDPAITNLVENIYLQNIPGT